MNRTRTAAVLVAAGALVAACTSSGDNSPAEVTARPVIEQPDTSGQPGQLMTDEQLRDAVHGLAPWLLPR